MSPLEAQVRALGQRGAMPLIAAIPGIPPAIISFAQERWSDIARILEVWLEGEALLIYRGATWDVVQALPQAELVTFVATHLSAAKSTLQIIRRPLGPGEVLMVISDGISLSAPRLRFLGESCSAGGGL